MQKYIKIPMTAGIILEAIAVVICMICVFMQKNITSAAHPEKAVFPPTLFFMTASLLIYIAYMFIMYEYKGDARRGVGTAILVFHALYGIVMPYINVLISAVYARTDSGTLAAVSILSSSISLLTQPFTIPAGMLVLISVGRYGISAPEPEEQAAVAE